MKNELNTLLESNRIDKILFELINLLLKYYNLESYVNSIQLLPLDYSVCGAYSDNIKRLVINKYILDIMYQLYDSKGVKYDFINEKKYVTNEILITILHEIAHVKQYKQIIENEKSLKSIILKDTRYIENEEFYYLDPNEKDANMFAYNELFKIIDIKSLYDIDVLDRIKMDYTRSIIHQGYEYRNLENGTLEKTYKNYIKDSKKYNILLEQINKLSPIEKIKINQSLTQLEKQILKNQINEDYNNINKRLFK